MDDALLKIDKMCHAIGFEPTETRKNQRVHEDIDTTCGYLLEDKQEIERLEKALDKMCRIFDEEIHNCDFLLIRNGLCDSKCTLCDQEKRVELMKEWVINNVY